jgi:hypothetical protein
MCRKRAIPLLARVMAIRQRDGPAEGNLSLAPALRAFPILAPARDCR